MRIVFYRADYLRGLRFLESYTPLFFSIHFNSPAGISIYIFSSVFKCNLIVWGWSIVTGRSGPSCHPQALNHHPGLICLYMLALVWASYTWTGSLGSGFYLTLLSDVLMARIKQKNTTHSMRSQEEIPGFQSLVGCLDFYFQPCKYRLYILWILPLSFLFPSTTPQCLCVLTFLRAPAGSYFQHKSSDNPAVSYHH